MTLLLHCLTALLLWQVLARLKVRGAMLAGAIFALHPVCVESVAWISEQKNTLSAVLYLLAALLYLKWRDREKKLGETGAAGPISARLYWMATGLFVLALLSKSVTATLPAALLVVLWWRRGRLSWREDAVPLIPWFGLGLAAGLFTAWVEHTVLGAEGSGFELGILDRFLLAGRVAWFYLGKLVWPANLIFIYPHWRVDAGEWGQYLFPAAALALVVALWEVSRRWSRGPLAGVLLFAGSLFPALGFFNVYPFLFSYVADHFQYLASLGIIALAAAGWELWRSRAERTGGAPAGRVPLPAAAAAAMLVLLGLLTNLQCRTYQNAETLYRVTLERNPACWMIEYNLGVTLHGAGRSREAVACYERALQLRPDFPQARNNLGVLLADAGRTAEAIAQYEAAIASYRRNPRLAPDHADAECNFGRALQGMGRTEEAVEHYERALRLKPDLASAASALGRLLADTGRIDDAIRRYQRALRLNPGNPELHNDLGAALCTAGRTAEAVAHFEEALRLRPDFADAVFNLATVLKQTGRVPEAIARYREALRLRPDFADASGCLGILLAESGRLPEAIGYYEMTLRLKPGSPDIHYDLGVALRETGRLPEAIAHYEAALRLKPNYPDAENDLGIAYAQSDRLAEAVAHFEAALRLKPDYADAHNNLGVVFRALGRAREAEAQFAEAARLGAAPAR